MSGTAEGALRKAGFAALRKGAPPTLGELAAAAGIDETEARAALRRLVGAGRATVAADGRLDGIAGITMRPTRHAIEWAGGRLQTWCAFDAVAIPAALGWTAGAVTTCGGCGGPLRVALHAGVPRSTAWGWLPPRDCEHVLDDFCAAADLYCDRAHLDRWHRAAANPPGEAHPVAALADLGREAWADCL